MEPTQFQRETADDLVDNLQEVTIRKEVRPLIIEAMQAQDRLNDDWRLRYEHAERQRYAAYRLLCQARAGLANPGQWLADVTAFLEEE